jgi:hypothetical protein
MLLVATSNLLLAFDGAAYASVTIFIDLRYDIVLPQVSQGGAGKIEKKKIDFVFNSMAKETGYGKPKGHVI